MFMPGHFLVRVEDLHQAVADYQAAGFTVVWGSDPQRAHNALIYFESGGFLELFNPDMPGPLKYLMPAIARMFAAFGNQLFARFSNWASARGLCDFAIETSESLADGAADARLRGARLSKIRDFSRVRADGVKTRWQLCMAHSRDLPFLMGPYSPPPTVSSAQRRHANGASRLLGLHVKTPEPGEYASELARLLGGHAIVSEHDSARRVTVGEFVFIITRGTRHKYAAVDIDQPPSPGARLHGLNLRAQQPQAAAADQ